MKTPTLRSLPPRHTRRDGHEVAQSHQTAAAETLGLFGLTESDLRSIAAAGRVVVTMPHRSEAAGWDARIFTWQYVLSRATKPFRATGTPSLTVMRHLQCIPAPALPAWPPRARVLLVHCFPSVLGEAYDAKQECERVRAAAAAPRRARPNELSRRVR